MFATTYRPVVLGTNCLLEMIATICFFKLSLLRPNVHSCVYYDLSSSCVCYDVSFSCACYDLSSSCATTVCLPVMFCTICLQFSFALISCHPHNASMNCLLSSFIPKTSFITSSMYNIKSRGDSIIPGRRPDLVANNCLPPVRVLIIFLNTCTARGANGSIRKKLVSRIVVRSQPVHLRGRCVELGYRMSFDTL